MRRVVKFVLVLSMRMCTGADDATQVITEISTLLKTLQQKRGIEFESFMTSSLLPSIQCPDAAAAAFVDALRQATE